MRRVSGSRRSIDTPAGTRVRLSVAGVTKRRCAPGAAGAAATHDELSGDADYATFCTLPLRMHDVHARRRRDAPFTTARTDCRFKSQRRLVTL